MVGAVASKIRRFADLIGATEIARLLSAGVAIHARAAAADDAFARAGIPRTARLTRVATGRGCAFSTGAGKAVHTRGDAVAALLAALATGLTETRLARNMRAVAGPTGATGVSLAAARLTDAILAE
jgi:hypothetical protein